MTTALNTGVHFRLQEVLFRAGDNSTLRSTTGVDARRRLRATTTPAVVRIVRTLLPHDGREHFVVLLLDGQYRALAWYHAAIGDIDGVRVHPREVFAAALRMIGCKSIIVAHNHPSGVATPTRADLKLTRDLVKAGVLLGIPLTDHVIIANGGREYLSLSERGMIR